MNEILEKNLSCIKRYNDNLATKIASIEKLPESLVLFQNENKEYNLQYNGNFVHSLSGAQKEADEIIKILPHNNINSIHITYGLGLGYLFETLYEKTSGRIILYEDNIELLRAVFEIVDFSKALGKDNIILVSNEIELKDAYFKFYTPKTQISLTCLDYYKKHYSNKINEIVKEIKNANEIAKGTYSYRLKNNYRIARSVIQKLNKKITAPTASVLLNKFKDLPAIIVSAGASLYDNLELLKEYQDKAVIFCVGNVYKTLRENGIKPQFVCIVEERYVEYQINDVKIDDVNLIATPTAFSNIFDYKFKNLFIYPSKENSVNSWYTEVVGEDNKDFEARGTVSYAALFSAYFAGCNPIVLIGQDLAYVNDCCYSQNSTYSSLKCRQNQDGKWEVFCEDPNSLANKLVVKGTYSRDIILNGIKNKVKMMTDQLVVAKNQYGEDIRTDVSFTYFAQYFSDFAKKYGHNITLINSSKGGLKIQGFENIDFDKVGEKYFTKNINFENIENNIKNDIKLDYKLIENNLEKEISSLKFVINEICQKAEIIQALEKQVKKYDKPLINTNVALNEALSLYDKITSKNLSKIYFYLMYKEQIELDEYLLNTDFTLPVIVKMCKLLSEFFEKSLNEVSYAIKQFEETKGSLNESSCTAC